MSVHFWGEDPHGSWTLAVTDNAHNNRQHHRYKTRFGDTEDAEEILQDKMNGEDHGDDFKNTEDLEDHIFKDDSFKSKNLKSKHRTDSSSGVERLREKSEKIRHESKLKRKPSNKPKGTSTNKDSNNNDENEAEVKILEELLGVKQTHDPPKPSSGILTSNSSEPFHEKRFNQSVTHSHDDNLNNMTSSQETNENSHANEPSQGAGDSETKMLESLLRGVISQVFSNFLQVNTEGSKSFEQRLSMLESLLGKKPEGEDDKVISGLMDAFKSGKAIDRVNNVLTILEDSKNNTKFTNTSFSRNADVVVDVLKVLKDVLNTEKGDKNLKGYKERVANLLEQQSGDTEKMTKKLLSDLKVSGTDSSDVVNDALILIRRIFQSEKKKTEKRDKNRKKKSNRPQSYEFTFEKPHQQPSENQKEITKSKQTKEIQHSEDDVEKITVERVKVKNPKQHSSQKIKKVFQSPLFEEITSKRTAFDNMDPLDFFQEEGTKTKDGFTLTITKNGEKISERKVDDVQALHLLQQPTKGSSFGVTTMGEKKQAINRDQGRNIDVEVVLDGKGGITKPFKKENDALKLKGMQTEKYKHLNSERFNKKMTVKTIDKHKVKQNKWKKTSVKQKSSSKVRNSTLQKNEEEDEEPIFPFLPFNGNEASFSGESNENFFPSSFNRNFEYPFISYNEQAVSPLEDFHETSSFEQPVKTPVFDIDKRSRLMNNQVPHSFFPYFSFLSRPEVPLNRRYRSFKEEEDRDDDGDGRSTSRPTSDENEKVRQKREDASDEEDMVYKHDESELNNLQHENETRPKSRHRRSVGDDKLVRNDKRNDEDEEGPHVVKRSAIFSDFYSSPSPVVVSKTDQVMTNSEKRSAIRKALSLEKALRKKLGSSKEDSSSSAVEILKRVHSDIANGDAKDLRILEKELSKMKPDDPTGENRAFVEDKEKNEDTEPINNFIKLVEQTENSSSRKNIPQESGKQTPEEYYKYGTSTSGILVSWTIKFYGT